MESRKYLVETHAHTSEVSECSELPARELVRLHKEAGYDAVVITDHYLHGATSSDKQRRRFMRGYELAKEAGDELGIVVLPGMELRFNDGGWDDFLVYLPDPFLYLELKGLTSMRPASFHRLAKDHGLLVYQAHPYRSYLNGPAPADTLDGIEVHNGNPDQRNNNHKALEFAQAHGLREISGSDVHTSYGLCRGGIYVPKEALTPVGFVAYLRKTPHPAFYHPTVD